MINLRKTLKEADAILKSHGIAHCLIGGFALAAYGLHRATFDIDFLADGTKRDEIRALLIANGFQLKFESSEVLQFVGAGFLDILLANRPLTQEMLKCAVLNSEVGVFVVRPEDIVGLKIQAYKNDPSREHQDKADIQGLLKLPQLDLDLVKKYADIFEEWTEIQNLQRLDVTKS